MNTNDINEIESALDLALPEDYKKTMLNYPFEGFSFADDCEFPNDPKRVIESNIFVRKDGFFGIPWKKQLFIFGGDGSGNQYYLDTTLPESPVFLADHEESSLKEKEAGSFNEFVKIRLAEYKQWEEEDLKKEEKRKNKKWWQFWI